MTTDKEVRVELADVLRRDSPEPGYVRSRR